MSKISLFGKIGGAVTKTSGKALLKCRKHSPEILLAGGIACGVGAVIAAVCDTKKAMTDETLAELNDALNDIQKREEAALEAAESDGVLKEAKKDIIVASRKESLKTFGKVAVQYVKIYAPTVGLVVLSGGMIIASHGVLKGRYLGAVAAYTALDESFKDYRKRNAAVIGEEAERKIFNGLEDVKVDVTDPETGKKKKETIQKQVDGGKKNSPYEFDFNRFTAPFDWEPNMDHNYTFLRQVQSLANDKLHARGHLMLHEVLDDLGMERTPASMVVGWIANGDGDGYVDFGFEEFYSDSFTDIEHSTDSMNIHMNFNVDGVVWNLI